jgi:hypothetical protein
MPHDQDTRALNSVAQTQNTEPKAEFFPRFSPRNFSYFLDVIRGEFEGYELSEEQNFNVRTFYSIVIKKTQHIHAYGETKQSTQCCDEEV